MNARALSGATFTVITAPSKAALILILVATVMSARASDRPTAAHARDANGAKCIMEGGGFLRARLSGSIDAELSWSNEGTTCAGSLRPGASGLRLQFTRPHALGEHGLVFVFGIPNVHEGQSARVVPVNVTLIREGTGEFFGTQGDDKCTLDELRQEPIAGMPLKSRAYRVIAKGFCTQPARAVRGKGIVLLSRFDFAGRLDIPSNEVAAPISARRP